jgi:hypothetical protein
MKESEMTTTLFIDGHVHIYPFHNAQSAVAAGIRNLRRGAGREGGTVMAWLLTERYDCNFFDAARQMKELHPEDTLEPESLVIHDSSGTTPIYVCAGRQIVTTDNLEVCALATRFSVKDRTLNTRDTIRAVNDAGGVAALNWAPGKWFFGRKRIVQNLLAEVDPATLLIGDTTLRPIGWMTPLLMKSAARKGFKILAGSDPLPFAGEEELVGSYGFTISGRFDPQKPARSIRELLTDPATDVSRSGKRNMPVTFVERHARVMMLKKRKP